MHDHLDKSKVTITCKWVLRILTVDEKYYRARFTNNSKEFHRLTRVANVALGTRRRVSKRGQNYQKQTVITGKHYSTLPENYDMPIWTTSLRLPHECTR